MYTQVLIYTVTIVFKTYENSHFRSILKTFKFYDFWEIFMRAKTLDF